MQMLNNILDGLYYGMLQPLFLGIRDLLDFVFLDSLSLLSVPQSAQVVIVAICTVLLAFLIRKILNVEDNEKVFRHKFAKQKAQRDTIAIIPDPKSRNALYTSADQSIDEDFNTYLAQHYFRYVLIYLLPLFLVLAWLNDSLDEKILTTISGHPYLFLLPSHPLGMEGVSVTLLFLLSYVLSLAVAFQLRRFFFKRK
jgi:hypothetical protein